MTHLHSLEVEVLSQLLAGSAVVVQKEPDRIPPFKAKSKAFRHGLSILPQTMEQLQWQTDILSCAQKTQLTLKMIRGRRVDMGVQGNGRRWMLLPLLWCCRGGSQLIWRSKPEQQGWHPVQWWYICGLCINKTVPICPRTSLWVLIPVVSCARHFFVTCDKGATRNCTSAWKTLGHVWSLRGFKKLSIREEYSHSHLAFWLYRAQLISPGCIP